jgi:hypothetical protein
VRLYVYSIPTYHYRYTFGILLVYFLWAVKGTRVGSGGCDYIDYSRSHPHSAWRWRDGDRRTTDQDPPVTVSGVIFILTAGQSHSIQQPKQQQQQQVPVMNGSRPYRRRFGWWVTPPGGRLSIVIGLVVVVVVLVPFTTLPVVDAWD